MRVSWTNTATPQIIHDFCDRPSFIVIRVRTPCCLVLDGHRCYWTRSAASYEDRQVSVKIEETLPRGTRVEKETAGGQKETEPTEFKCPSVVRSRCWAMRNLDGPYRIIPSYRNMLGVRRTDNDDLERGRKNLTAVPLSFADLGRLDYAEVRSWHAPR